MTIRDSRFWALSELSVFIGRPQSHCMLSNKHAIQIPADLIIRDHIHKVGARTLAIASDRNEALHSSSLLSCKASPSTLVYIRTFTRHWVKGSAPKTSGNFKCQELKQVQHPIIKIQQSQPFSIEMFASNQFSKNSSSFYLHFYNAH